MSQDKHTPAPWEACGGAVTKDDLCLAECQLVDGVPQDEAWANAQLISKLPNLLTALEEALEREYNSFEPNNQSDRYYRWEKLIKEARGEKC